MTVVVAMPSVDLTVYRGATNPSPIARDTITWDEFCNEVEADLALEYTSKTDMLAFGPYRLKPGTTRSAANVGQMSSLIGLDLDCVASTDNLIKELRSLGIASIVHTSPSDPGPDGATRKVRVYILSEPHDPKDCGRVRRALASLLGETLDPQTCNADRIYFIGKLAGTPAREVWRVDGDPMPLGAMFAAISEPLVSGVRQQKAAAAPVTAELDDGLRSRLDRAIEMIEPEFVEGLKHGLAVAIGAYLCNRKLPKAAGDYVGSKLCNELGLSNNPRARIKDFTDAWGMNHPAGAQALRELAPELLAELDTIFADTVMAAYLARHTFDGQADWATLPVDEGEPLDERRTELGNARRLIRMHGDRLRCFRQYKTWFIWDGLRWAEDNTGAVERLAKETAESLWQDAVKEDDDRRKAAIAWAAKSQDRSRIANMIALAETEPGIPVTAANLDAHPWLLNVRNGTLNLQTGDLSEPDPALLMTKCCAVTYDPEARSDLWDAFVRHTTGGDDELVAYIQRALGYALVGTWLEKRFWFGYGPPDGAKSTLLGVVGDVMGDYHVSAAASTWMVQSNLGGNRGDITRLRGARLVTSLEIRPGLRFDEELVKKVTGGDRIVAAAKYKDEIEFTPTFALWMGANDRPTIRDDDEGMWSRMRCVPFTNPVPKSEQDPRLRAKLTSDEHAPAVLRWLVDGCLAYQRDGLGGCEAVASATRDYRTSMNQAAGFVEEAIEVTGDPNDEVPCRDMMHAYEQWCARNGVRNPLPPKALGQRLRTLGVLGGDDTTRHAVGRNQHPGRFSQGTIDRHWLGARLIRSE